MFALTMRETCNTRAMSDALEIIRLDHLVLTVADVERTVAFYERVLSACAR